MINSFTYDEYPVARPGGYGTGEAVRRGQVIINGFFDGKGFEDCQQDYQDHKDTTVLPYDFLPAGEDRGINAGEIVFELLPTRNTGLQHACIRSILNGIPVEKSKILRDDYERLDQVPPEIMEKRMRQALLSRIVFRGLAQDNTPFSMDEETGTAIVVLGGKGTVNTSRKAISPGDIIVATLPKKITHLKRVVPETSPLTPELMVEELFPENVMFMTEEMRKFMEMMFRLSVTTFLEVWRQGAVRLDGGLAPAARVHVAAYNNAVDTFRNIPLEAVDYERAAQELNTVPLGVGGAAPAPPTLNPARDATIRVGNNAVTGARVTRFSKALVDATNEEGHAQKFLMKGLVPCAGMLTTGLTAITIGVAQSGAPPMGKYEITVTAPTRNVTNDMINY